jgi:hypothetical protein
MSRVSLPKEGKIRYSHPSIHPSRTGQQRLQQKQKLKVKSKKRKEKKQEHKLDPVPLQRNY